MKWIKVSERMPDKGQLKFMKAKGWGVFIGVNSVTDGKIHESSSPNPLDYDYSLIEWLDESPSPSLSAEQEAREYAACFFPDAPSEQRVGATVGDVRDSLAAAYLSGKASGGRFVNVYRDDNGRFLSNDDYDSFESAYKNRDQVRTYLETVQICNPLPTPPVK